MRSIAVCITILFALFTSMNAAVNCFAPLNEWGPVCILDKSITGQKGWYLNYHLVPLTGGALIDCVGVGMAEYSTSPVCQWKLQNLGTFPKNYGTVIWDSAQYYPYVKCKSRTFETVYTFDVSTGNSNVSCIRGNTQAF